jgi:uncharacterized RDD family membrane protein YckC
MKTIEITTTQNVTIEYHFASVGERIFAFIIDIVILGFASILWTILVMNILRGSDGDHFLSLFLFGFFPIICYFLYFLLFEGFTGQTLGKKALAIKVVRLDGQEPQLGDYGIRALFHLLDTFFSLGILATALVASTDKHQRIGDMAANTCVVKLNPVAAFRLSDILRIDSKDSYEPVYPQVTQLKEEDMLLVKTTLARYRAHQNESHTEAVISITQRICEILNIEYPSDSIHFLNVILKDYIVLTR